MERTIYRSKAFETMTINETKLEQLAKRAIAEVLQEKEDNLHKNERPASSQKVSRSDQHIVQRKIKDDQGNHLINVNALSRETGIPQSTLNKAVTGERGLSKKNAERINTAIKSIN